MPRVAHLRAPGFTLVELCVVLAVSSVLVTIAWPSFQSQLQRGRRADAVTALLRVHRAAEVDAAYAAYETTPLDAPERGCGWPVASDVAVEPDLDRMVFLIHARQQRERIGEELRVMKATARSTRPAAPNP
jgi:type IV pilus assembly protein PilE